MSEIGDKAVEARAHDKVYDIIIQNRRDADIGSHKLTATILAILELAIVDREAELPELKSLTGRASLVEKASFLDGVKATREVIRKAGWVKEIGSQPV